MTKVLSKYSQATNISPDYITQKEYMDKIAAGESATLPADFNNPFSFKQWKQRNIGIIPGKEYKQYTEYLTQWYQDKYTSEDAVNQLKDDYVNLLKQIPLTFTSQEEEDWYSDIDFTNDLDLEDAIPIYARRLKEIAIYFVIKREAIKKAKLKYNMTGAKSALERLFYEYLLKAFTQRNYVLNVPEQSAYNIFPQLSAVANGFSVVVQELYDDTNYFDKDPKVPISAYYDLTTPTVTSYFNTLEFSNDDLTWLFGTGVNELCANNPLIYVVEQELQDLPLSAFQDFGKKVLNDIGRIDLTQKYLGEEQYIISGGKYVLDTKNFIYNLQQGNNWFYWPSGEYYNEQILEDYGSIPLTATSIITDGASASKDYYNADKIFVQVDNVVSGAWLKSIFNETLDATMSAVIPSNEHYIFKFPYPNYGVSGEALSWTGRNISNVNSIFNYLDENIQRNILDLYWSTVSAVSAFKSISIHDTELVNNGAISNQEYYNADSINVRVTPNPDNVHDSNPDSIYHGKFNYAWLYRMLTTDIPIKVGQTNINWPIETFSQNESQTSLFKVPTSQCIPVTLSSIDIERTMVGARAGHSLFDSDIIYKMDSPNGVPVECAFLSGAELSQLAISSSYTHAEGASGIIQPSFTLICNPGIYETFMWQDSNININNTTISHKQHQSDCLYLAAEHNSIFNSKGVTLDELNLIDTGIGNWKKCTCKSILYSPIGHPGSEYDNYDRMADIVFIDTQWPDPFDITTWRGTDNLPYDQSKDFAWFQLVGDNVEPDVGWGTGNWKTGSGTTSFILSAGVLYKYLRANLRRNPGDLLINAVPELIIKQEHNNTPPCRWMKANLNEDGTWVKTYSRSNMVINPGDYILYDHIDSNWYCLTSDSTQGNVITQQPSALTPTTWSNYSYITIGQTIRYIWPNTFTTDGPTTIADALTSVTWYLSSNEAVYNAYKISPDAPFTFTPQSTGMYIVSAIGYTNQGDQELVDTTYLKASSAIGIPPVEVVYLNNVTSSSGSVFIDTIYNNTINFLINIPLSGWNYNTNSYDSSSLGGRPFWAKAYDDNSKQTKFKGNNIWGGGIRSGEIDDYTLITQPDVATIILSTNQLVDYYHKGTGLIWKQPIERIINEETKQWSKLIITNSTVSPLSAYLLNIDTEMTVYASDDVSDIVLYQPDNGMFINYWSQGPFTWTQQLTNITDGIPPTGGKWIAPITGDLITPLVPYANLTNRHYPTIASVPYIGEIYSEEDSGGYFIPKGLGVSVYLGKNYNNVLDMNGIINNTGYRGLSAVFQDPTKYITDRGFTQTNQVSLLSTNSIDSSWMKATYMSQQKAGEIINAKTYQEYIPYQTKYESIGRNQNGISLQSDEYDPWTGDLDNTWANPNSFPPNFRNEYDILGWYDQIVLPNKYIDQWKTDIFGNQYALYKSRSITGIYNRKQATGEFWTRSLAGRVYPAVDRLSAVYDKMTFASSAISSALVNNDIRKFDIWFDTIMIETTGHILIEKLNFDYEANHLYSIADDFRSIELSGSHAGTWLFEEDKEVAICNGINTIDGPIIRNIRPDMYVLDLDTHTLINKEILNITLADQTNNLLMTAVEDPVFTYNTLTRTYNFTYLGYPAWQYVTGYTDRNGPIITTMNIMESAENFVITKLYSVLPA